MSLSGDTRERLLAAMNLCPRCGRGGMSQRQVAQVTGVSPSTICRFVRGEDVAGSVLDKIDAWLRRREGQK